MSSRSFFAEHGVTRKDFLEVVSAQRYKCACCGETDSKGDEIRSFIADSTAEETPSIQAVCKRCKSLIDIARPNPRILALCILYLQPQ